MMTTTEIPLRHLVRELDTLFAIHEWEGEPAMSRFLPRAYEREGHGWRIPFEADFCRRFNGLMLRSGEVVRQVNCAAFPASSEMALLGFSHAATEFLVMKTQMADYVRQKGLQIRCLAQSDWWR